MVTVYRFAQTTFKTLVLIFAENSQIGPKVFQFPDIQVCTNRILQGRRIRILLNAGSGTCLGAGSGSYLSAPDTARVRYPDPQHITWAYECVHFSTNICSTVPVACIHIRFGALKNTDSFENWFEVARYLPRASLLQRTVLELPSRIVVSKNWFAARDAWNWAIRDW